MVEAQMIHYISPYATDGNIGRALNEACTLVPDGDWICLRDGDAMFTTPDWGRTIDYVIREYGGQYDLFGAVTNRIGWKHHQVPGMMDVMDLRQHWEVGAMIQANGPQVEPTTELIAGFFMLFSKATWSRTQFQEDRRRARLFDMDFSMKIKRRAIIRGLYLLHLYRIWSDNPRGDIKHLT